MCGTNEKPCCICYFGSIGSSCLASMHEDYYAHATKNQVLERLTKGDYQQDRGIMKKYLKDRYDILYEPKVIDKFKTLSSKELAKFLWQIQIGLRRGSSENDWEEWIESQFSDLIE